MKIQWKCKEHYFALSKQKEKKSNIMNDYSMRLGITCMRPKGNYANRGVYLSKPKVKVENTLIRTKPDSMTVSCS